MEPIRMYYYKKYCSFSHEIKGNEVKITAETPNGLHVEYTIYKNERGKYIVRNDYPKTYASTTLLRAIVAKGKELLKNI